jgi:hypothetical protein
MPGKVGPCFKPAPTTHLRVTFSVAMRCTFCETCHVEAEVRGEFTWKMAPECPRGGQDRVKGAVL